MRFIVLCAILLLPAAYAIPPKARVVTKPDQGTKVLVSKTADSAAGKVKDTTPKVVAARPVSCKKWRWVPKFQKSGKEDTTWGFLFRRPF